VSDFNLVWYATIPGLIGNLGFIPRRATSELDLISAAKNTIINFTILNSFLG